MMLLLILMTECLAQVPFPLLTLPRITQSKTSTTKQASLPAGAWTSIAGSSDGPGMIRRIWFAFQSNLDGLYVSITMDGASTPQIGAQPTTPSFTNALPMDVWLTASFGSYSCQNTEYFKCNNYGPTSYGGYAYPTDMPFQSNWVLSLYAMNGTEYWVQVFYDIYPEPGYALTPLRLHMQLNANYWPPYVASYPSENPLFSQNGANGVYLKWLKWFVIGLVTGFIEGEFSVCTSTVGLFAPSNTPFCSQQTLLQTSSGMEDLFQSSWGFVGDDYYSLREVGYLYNSDGEGTLCNAPCNATAYKAWGTRLNQYPINAQSNLYLTLTWAPGNVVAGAQGSASFAALTAAYW